MYVGFRCALVTYKITEEMYYSKIRPMIWSAEIKETVAFYTSCLGFECLAFDEETGWASLQKNDAEIMVALPNSHMEFAKPTFTGSLYINTNDVDLLWDKLKGKAKVCYAIEDFDYGMREFAIYDNNGYIIQFGQPLTDN